MSRWMTHSICDACWQIEQGDREPSRFIEGQRIEERCCWCGLQNRSGIYVRADADVLPECGWNQASHA